jgi:membrane-associated phospholipid phosphatase
LARASLEQGKAACREIRARRFSFIGLAALTLMLTLVAFRFDRRTDAAVVAARPRMERLRTAAHHLRWWGRGHDTMAFSLLLLGWAAIRRDRRWARVALACALSAIVTGIAINVVRVGAGRPRPRADVPDRLVGPTLNYKYQSFPSGHTSASFGAAGCLLVAAPPLGVAALVSAAGVGGGSVFTRAHYLSDVTAGVGAGLFFGLAFGLGVRWINRASATSAGPRGSPCRC